MDVPKSPQEMVSRRRRRLRLGVVVCALAIAAAYGVSRVGRAAPAVSAEGLWTDTVREGDITRELHGVGELVPDDGASRWVAAEVEGRVERKLLEVGAVVRPETVLFELSNPDIEQAVLAAELALEAAEAQYASLEASLRTDLLALRSAAEAVESDRAQAAIQAEVDQALVREGLIGPVTAKQSAVRAQALSSRMQLERERVEATANALSTRLATQRSEVESRRTLAALKRRDRAAMTVRAGMEGVLQEIPVEVGQRLARSTNMAFIVDPARLKARLRIPEAQTDDLRLGLSVTIDTHIGVVPARVTRVAPTATNGTVAVDCQLEEALPRGARPDMTVDGSIHLERVANVRFMGRPAAAGGDGPTSVYRLTNGGREAERVLVRLSRASANTVRIVEGDLRPGDQVVLSDTSGWRDQDRVRLR